MVERVIILLVRTIAVGFGTALVVAFLLGLIGSPKGEAMGYTAIISILFAASSLFVPLRLEKNRGASSR